MDIKKENGPRKVNKPKTMAKEITLTLSRKGIIELFLLKWKTQMWKVDFSTKYPRLKMIKELIKDLIKPPKKYGALFG